VAASPPEDARQARMAVPVRRDTPRQRALYLGRRGEVGHSTAGKPVAMTGRARALPALSVPAGWPLPAALLCSDLVPTEGPTTLSVQISARWKGAALQRRETPPGRPVCRPGPGRPRPVPDHNGCRDREWMTVTPQAMKDHR
jgi:hypothetical protein